MNKTVNKIISLADRAEEEVSQENVSEFLEILTNLSEMLKHDYLNQDELVKAKSSIERILVKMEQEVISLKQGAGELLEIKEAINAYKKNSGF